LLNYLDRASIAVALPAVSTELALGPTSKGLLLSAFFWSYTVMQLPVGWFADRYALRWLYAGMFALWSLACGLTGLAGSLATLIGLRVALGIGESIYLPASTKIVGSLFEPRHRGLPSGTFISGTRAGLTLGTLLLAWLVVYFGWRKMFFIVGFSGFVWLIPWLLIFPGEPPNRRKTPSHPRLKGGRCHAGGWTLNRNLAGLSIGLFCLNYYFYPLITWLPQYFVEARKFTLFQAGVYGSLSYAIFGLSEPLGGWIADRLISLGWDEARTRKGIITIAAAAGLLLIPAMLVSGRTTAIVLLGGASLVGLSTGNFLAILQFCAPQEEIGVWTGIVNVVGNLAGVIAPLTIGILISRTGSYVPGFALGSILLAFGVLPYWVVLKSAAPAERSQ
jgi:MFS family permease